MLLRFSLYGFLKNQRYFEPFLVLAFVEKGLSFFAIGGLIALREVVTNALEIPSGAVADVLGRRRSMIASFAAYVASFVVFWAATELWSLVAAMGLFAVGEAFRTGTHKAMIFEWLRQQGRTGEKTAVYGHTRSWSKLGSAASVAIGAGFVFAFDGYSEVFLLAAVPAALNIVNFMGYPRALDGERDAAAGLGEIWRVSLAAVRAAVRERPLRRLLVESMGFEGVFHAAKDYLQPLLAAAAMAWFAEALPGEGWSEIRRTTLLVGPVYLSLHLASAFASRRAHRLVAATGGEEERAARLLWGVAGGLFLLLLVGELATVAAASIAAFVALHVAQNLWRPILISRFDGVADASRGAVTLSVESQARRLATMLLAPLFGWAVDRTRGEGAATAVGDLWPIGAVGLAVAAAMLLRRRR